MVNIGQKIKKLRTDRGWTLQETATAMGLKHRQTVHYWESDKDSPNTKSIAKLAKVFNVSPAYFFE